MIILYRGSRGKGKTLTMVKDAKKFYDTGYKVFSNLSLKFGSVMNSSEIIQLNHTSELRDCVLVIDEIELFFDSRNFSKSENKTFSQFLQQIRKRNIVILSTAQYPSLIDLRIRQQLDVVVYPRYDRLSKCCFVLYFNLNQMEDIFVKTQLKPFTLIYDATQIFQLYDTNELLS